MDFFMHRRCFGLQLHVCPQFRKCESPGEKDELGACCNTGWFHQRSTTTGHKCHLFLQGETENYVENWMVEGEHSFTKTGRLCQASYATVCQWIVDAWHKVSARTVIQGFVKADIVPGLTSDGIESTETHYSDDEDTGDTGLGLLDATTAQLMISNMEDKEFEGFME
ncbi:hypothetical protein TURU_037822 [Turdus rufiventris]|nr:hypothetical protein TURU_037822 [Turdus rufiventris]